MLGVPSSIHGWKEQFFFVAVEEPWSFEVAWHTPWMDLNCPVSLGQEEAESLAHILECSSSAFELLEEETLVNVNLILVEPGGVLGSSDVYRRGGQSRQVAEDVAKADSQLAVWLLLKVFASAYKKVQRWL